MTEGGRLIDILDQASLHPAAAERVDCFGTEALGVSETRRFSGIIRECNRRKSGRAESNPQPEHYAGVSKDRRESVQCASPKNMFTTQLREGYGQPSNLGRG